MSPTDPSVFPGSRVTRRRVVATGVKLAYAAPLMAASFKLSATAGLAQDACTDGENCAAGVIVNCGTNGACACVRNVDGGFTCVDRICSFTACTTGADCPSGLCISAPGCCGDPDPFCGTPCSDEPISPTSFGPGIQSAGWR